MAFNSARNRAARFAKSFEERPCKKLSAFSFANSFALDVLGITEHTVVFRDAHGAGFSGPIVNILKQVTVDCSEMGVIQVTGRRLFVGPGIADLSLESG